MEHVLAPGIWTVSLGGTATVVTLMILPAFARAERSWVDPPVTSNRGPAQVPDDAPSNDANDATHGAASSTDILKHADAARQLMMDYLDFWSAPNALALEAMPRFYAQHVDFHGRRMSSEALFAEKRRFVRRWPLRSYTARIETLRATCAPAEQTCSVKVLFDFAALSPERSRRSQGTANLELQLSFAGERPTILAETSRVVSRGRTRARPFDDIED